MTPLVFSAVAACAHPPAPVGRIADPTRRGPTMGILPAVVAAVVLAALLFDRASLVVAASAAAATALHVVVHRRRAQLDARRGEVAAAFLGHVATASEAGSALPAALARAAEQLPAGAPEELVRDISQLVHHASRGSAFEARTPELARVQAMWSLAATHGIPVTGLVTAARDELDHSQRHRKATRAALAGPTTTAIILSLLPLAGVLMGTAMGANPVGFLTGGGVGGILLIVGTAFLCAGVIVAETIIREVAS